MGAFLRARGEYANILGHMRERDVTARVNYYICAGSEHLFGFLQQKLYHFKENAKRSTMEYIIILVHTEQKLRVFKILDIYAWVHYSVVVKGLT